MKAFTLRASLLSSTVPMLGIIMSLLILSPDAQAQGRIAAGPEPNLSLKLEIERSIAKGVAYLKSQQDAASGAWSDPDYPAFTALAVSALIGDPGRDLHQPLSAEIEQGYAFLLANRQADGGIYAKGLSNYNTSLAIMALVQSGKAEHLPVIAKARRFLVNLQHDYEKPGVADSLYDGGIGYGSSTTAHSDLSNTSRALEALYYSKKALADTEYSVKAEEELDWDAAISFISATQNSEASVQRWGESFILRPEDKGGFVYYPGNTKSDQIEIPITGAKPKIALRSYGSMTYTGLLSFLYADMDSTDPRVVAALDWLQQNYTLDENPGMDSQGLYYYYHTMSKALALSGLDILHDATGKRIDWKQDLALRILSLQKRDGSWKNEASNRWMEDDPDLVTAYSLLALEQIWRQL